MAAQYDTELAAKLQAVVVTNYVDYALAALVFYDYIITVAQEIRVVWQKCWSLTGVLLILNRYIILFNAVLSVLIDLTWGKLSCNVFQRLNEATIIATYVIIALFAATRIFALWGKNRYLFCVVFSLNLIPAITNLIYFTGVKPTPYIIWPVISQCNLTFTMSPEVSTAIVRATRIPMIIADALVLLLTWKKTFEEYRAVRKFPRFASFHTLLLRDGTIYFLLLLVLNLCQLILVSTSISPIAPFIYTLTPILTSRFILNLRQEEQDRCGGSGNSRSASSFIGNIGNDLDWRDDDSNVFIGGAFMLNNVSKPEISTEEDIARPHSRV